MLRIQICEFYFIYFKILLFCLLFSYIQSIMFVVAKKGVILLSLPRGYKLTDRPKDTTIQVRLDKEYVDKLDECKEHLQTNRSEVIRCGIDKVYDEIKK